ncbi:TolC family protein, partial [Klebsiella pneumoniae]|uniref:TolC family protein n=1 Tax=Klebsiella pneumoniae TaxID=573 RepID=UPI003852C336
VAQTKLQDQKVELAKQQLSVTRAELIRNVTIAYYQLLFGKQRFQMLSNLETSYKDFSTYANKKYTLGESNQLEKLSAEAQLKQIQLEQQQAQNDI